MIDVFPELTRLDVATNALLPRAGRALPTLHGACTQGVVAQNVSQCLHDVLREINRQKPRSLHQYYCVWPESNAHIYSYQPRMSASVQRNVGFASNDWGEYVRIGRGFKDDGRGSGSVAWNQFMANYRRNPGRYNAALARLPHLPYAELWHAVLNPTLADINAAGPMHPRSNDWRFIGIRIERPLFLRMTTAQFATLAHNVWDTLDAAGINHRQLLLI